MMGAKNVLSSFLRHAPGSDISIIEGNMGLYDGMDLEGSDSTAGLARLLKSPVVLVIDCSGMTRGIAPLVRGFETFEPDTDVAGVILNRVRGARHEKKLRDAIERYCDARVLGALPFEEDMGIAMRHLGLVPLKEDRGLSPAIDVMARVIGENIDLDSLVEIARSAHALDYNVEPVKVLPKPVVRIGVAMDRAFTFYYPDNLEALKEAGAELVPFSPMTDQKLPDVDGLYIGGGFPEVHMEALERNSSMRESVRKASGAGMPVYAECGGLMYLCRSISWEGKTCSMAGVFPHDVKMSNRPAGHGYVILNPTGKGPLSDMNGPIRAHEFHHSSIELAPGAEFAYTLERGKGIDGAHDGLLYQNVLAGYTHIHILGAPEWASKLVNFINSYTQKNLLTNQKA
jgi:cobyrinic acid a,c-diamide synthase